MRRASLARCFRRRVEDDEGEVGAEPLMILVDASAINLIEAENALQDTEDVFYFGSYL